MDLPVTGEVRLALAVIEMAVFDRAEDWLRTNGENFGFGFMAELFSLDPDKWREWLRILMRSKRRTYRHVVQGPQLSARRRDGA